MGTGFDERVQRYWQDAVREMLHDKVQGGETCLPPSEFPKHRVQRWTSEHARQLRERGFVCMQDLISNAKELAEPAAGFIKVAGSSSTNPCNRGALWATVNLSRGVFQGFPSQNAQIALWEFVSLVREVDEAGYSVPLRVPKTLVLGCYPAGHAHYTRHLDRNPDE